MTQAGSVPLFTAIVKTQPQIRDDQLRTLSNYLKGLGITDPNVGPGSDYFGIADGVANELAAAGAYGIVTTDNQMPDTAAGPDLDRWLALYNIKRKGATQSAGIILPAYSIVQGYTTIPVNAQLVDSAGLRYEVLAGGSYGPGNPGAGQPANLYVPVQAIDTGSATDHANGDQLQWVSSIAYVGPFATVGKQGGTDGLSGGNDSEVNDDEAPRARLFDRIQNPPGGGNWPQVAQWVRDSSPDVQDAGIYPALQGGGNLFFAAWGAPQTSGVLSSTSKNRSLPAALISGTVLPYVQGLYPTRAVVVGASAVDVPNDVALVLNLPAATTALPAGPGGGWLDGTPWPSSVFGAPCTVLAVTSSTVFRVSALTPPAQGISHIAYVSPSNWQMYKATVVSVTGTAGAYTITIDTPFPTLPTDFGTFPICSIFPQAAQQDNYLAALLQGFANLGAGEWTASAVVLARSFRHPSSAQTWPSALDASFLRTVEDAGSEVKSATYLFRNFSAGPAVPTPPISILTVEPFTLLSAAPGIFVPRSLSWYQS